MDDIDHVFMRISSIFCEGEGEEPMKEYSEIFGQEYEIEDTVRIVNTKQAGMYIKHNIPLVDLFWSRDTLVFVFQREASRKAYELWCRHELT